MRPGADLRQLQRAFVPPAGLARSLPREVTLTAGGRVVVTAAVVLVALAIVVFVAMFSTAIRQANDRRVLRETGVDATAEVTRLWRASDKAREPRVAYQFVLDGRVFEANSTIGLARWRTLTVGSPFPIRFPDGHPDRSVPSGIQPPALPMWLPFVVSAAIALGGVTCVFWLSFERRLVREGRAAPAIVTKITTHHTSHGGNHRDMRYEFLLLSGAAAVGKSRAPRKTPAVGSVICVVYDPDQPRRSLPYPAKLVRPAVLRNP